MAVHPEYPGLTVQILVNGEPLPEYEDEDATDNPKVVTKYIEAQAGTDFEIERVYPDGLSGSDDVRTRCYINDQEVRSFVNTSISRQSGPRKKIAYVKERKRNSWYRRSLQFQRLCISKSTYVAHSCWTVAHCF
jgi:hypothetical protein